MLEELNDEFPPFMEAFIDNLDRPGELKIEPATKLLGEIKSKSAALSDRVSAAFAKTAAGDREFFDQVIAEMPTKIEELLERWFTRIRRIFEEFEHLSPHHRAGGKTKGCRA